MALTMDDLQLLRMWNFPVMSRGESLSTLQTTVDGAMSEDGGLAFLIFPEGAFVDAEHRAQSSAYATAQNLVSCATSHDQELSDPW